MSPTPTAHAERRSDFWMRMAGIAFGLWSIMIPAGAVYLRSSLTEAIEIQQRANHEFRGYVRESEKRISQLEERVIELQRRLAQAEQRLGNAQR